MKTLRWWLFVCLSGLLVFAPFSVQAKKKNKAAPTPSLATPAPEPPPLPAEAGPAISPDAPPSASLQPFVDTHVGKILAPLGVSAFAQPELIAGMKASYADGMAAGPPAHKLAFQLAQMVCDAMTNAITERQNAVVALRGALATRSSEAEQPRGGGEAVAAARDKDAFFVESEKNTWVQHSADLSKNIIALSLRERAVERQIGVWSPPPPPAPAASAPAAQVPAVTPANSAPAAPPAPVVTAATPSVSAPTGTVPGGPYQGWDPIIGEWVLEGRSRLTLGADHTVSGGRSGTWTYTCTTNAGRNYELHWKPPKNWVDYLVLSQDGKTLDGKSRNSHISYFRP